LDATIAASLITRELDDYEAALYWHGFMVERAKWYGNEERTDELTEELCQEIEELFNPA
jgi:hypothetical protein